MDKHANMALGFSASSSSIHPQIRYTGRLGTDPINTMTLGEGHIFDGAGSQVSTSGRWGDYSDMTVDPVDDETFWFTTEYYDTTSSFNWRTRIASFKLATGGGDNIVLTARRKPRAIRHGLILAGRRRMAATSISCEMARSSGRQRTTEAGKTSSGTRVERHSPIRCVRRTRAIAQRSPSLDSVNKTQLPLREPS